MPTSDSAYQRIFDANWNRASEGIRVVEDYVRLGCNDAQLSGQLKHWRHDLTAACQTVLTQVERLAARNTQADVGTELETDSETVRVDSGALIAANLERTQQAIRCLEEYAKALGKPSRPLEQLRYRLYDLQTAVVARLEHPSQLASANLYVLVTCGRSLEQFESYCVALLDAGVDVLQLRDKRATDHQLLETARVLVECCRKSQSTSIINDRPDVAALSGADGVHLGQEEMGVADARQIVGAGRIVGVSTHSVDQLATAIADGADYVGCGPTFPSSTKSFDEYPGLQFLTHVGTQVADAIPAFAIGGIHRDNLGDVLKTGVRRIAVSQAIHGATDPAAEATQLKGRLEQKK